MWKADTGDVEDVLALRAKKGAVGLVRSYRVHIKAAGQPHFKCVLDSRDAFEHTIEGLEADTRHEVCVEVGLRRTAHPPPCAAPLNGHELPQAYSMPFVPPGLGTRSPVTTCSTPAAPPDLPPDNLRAPRIAVDELEVAWDAPAGLGSRITGYRLFYDAEGSQGYREVELPPDATQYTARLLEAGTRHRFQVLARTAAGDGKSSPPFVVSTLESAASRLRRFEAERDARAPGRRRSAEVPAPVAPAPLPTAAAPKAAVEPSWHEQRSSGAHRKKRSERSGWLTGGMGEGDGAATTLQRSVGALGGIAAPAKAAHKTPAVPRGSVLWDSSDAQTTSLGLPKAVRQPEVRSPAPAAPAPALVPRKAPNFVQYRQPTPEPEPEPEPDFFLSGAGAFPRVRAEAEVTGYAARVAVGDSFETDWESGEIRGKTNAVRAHLEVMTGSIARQGRREDPLERLKVDERSRGALVMYTTTNAAIRTTFDTCTAMMRLFDLLRVKVERRDAFLDPAVLAELEGRQPGAPLPFTFLKGDPLGDWETVQQHNEAGKLKGFLRDCSEAPRTNCPSCGGAGYITCTWCQGSTKSTKNPFGAKLASEFNALRCSICNVNGLMRCSMC